MVSPFSSSATIILPDDLCRNLVREAAATQPLTPNTPMGLRVLINVTGEAPQGLPIMKSDSHTNYALMLAYFMEALLPSVRAARTKECLQFIGSGKAADFSLPMDPACKALIDAFNASKPKTQRPGQIRVALGAVSASMQY